mgnify:FL=1
MEYVLKTKRDIEILNSCKKLEKLKLSKADRDLVTLNKTQLERDWRKYLLNALEKLLRKYN